MTPTTLEQAPANPAADGEHSPETMLVVPEGVRLIIGLEDFERLCQVPENRDLRLERESDGGLIVMAPAGMEGSWRNGNLFGQLWNWNRENGLGRMFESSGGMTFPNTAVRAPDVSWIASPRWEALSEDDRRRFTHVVPDFVAELHSPSDSLTKARAKMAEYIAQGVRLGWLIDPSSQTVEIYRPGREPETLTKPATLSGEDVMPGLVLDLKGILFD
ncbi:Uma2 family endonuclease [Paludisphaera rhizosphaerae]|uniref:Uma2 family endonuclease n=1 Tax=Paludisphaera rhizosphaerae TaxID=2711216 RepID=UPI00197EB3EF|nr:Uma2 family endonuclease [Paludisphaera rhizosphaerae]